MERDCSDLIEFSPPPDIALRLAEAAALSGRSLADEMLHQIDAGLAATELRRSAGLTVDS